MLAVNLDTKLSSPCDLYLRRQLPSYLLLGRTKALVTPSSVPGSFGRGCWQRRHHLPSHLSLPCSRPATKLSLEISQHTEVAWWSQPARMNRARAKQRFPPGHLSLQTCMWRRASVPQLLKGLWDFCFLSFFSFNF